MSNSSVDDGGVAGLHYEAHIDPCRHTGEIHHRYCPLGVLCNRNFSHSLGEINGRRRRAGAYKTCYSRRRPHSEPAEAHGLHDGAVAHVRVRILC